ncbi:MAG: wax ester/triacylglycerol synthase family O-acyltransferase [Acidimicrobiia bacterium]
MHRASGLDTAFLYGETNAWHMHVSALMLLDPSETPDGYSFDRLRESFAERLPLAPQFSWKLHEVPLGLDNPVFVEDPDFDFDYHIRRIAVPPPGGPEQLGNLVGDLVSYKLDRDHPLWEFWVIEGLEDDRVALLAKVHHAIIDGVTGVGLFDKLFDLEPDPPRDERQPVPARPTERVPSGAELFLRGLGRTAVTPWRLLKFTPQIALQGGTLASFMRRDESPAIPFRAPRTSLNRVISPHRRFAYSSVSLDEVKKVKNTFGVKLNDVVLALCAGALRNYLDERGELPDAPLVAQVPMSLHTDGSKNSVGTQVAAMFASLATDIDDPVERLEAIYRGTQASKEMQRAMAARKIMNLSDTTPPGLLSLAARTYTASGLESSVPPVYNLIISNVPGPPVPIYVAGMKLEALWPMGPLLYGSGLNATVLSYIDTIDFGFMSCRESVPNPALIADGVPTALRQLRKAAKKVRAVEKKPEQEIDATVEMSEP